MGPTRRAGLRCGPPLFIALSILPGGATGARAQVSAPAPAAEAAGDPSVQPGPLRVTSPALRAAQPVAAFPAFTLLTLFDSSFAHNVFPGRETKSRGTQETALFNVNISPDLTIGIGQTYSTADARLLYLGNGRQTTAGPGAFMSAALSLGDGWLVASSFGYSSFESKLVRSVGETRSVADFHTRNLLGSLAVSRFAPLSDILYVQPSVRLQFTNAHSDSYVESAGFFSPEKTTMLGRVSTGAQVGALLPVAGWTLVPNAEANYLYDFRKQYYQNDRTGLEVRAGAFAVRGDLSVGASVSTVLGRRDYKALDGIRGFLSYRFGPIPEIPQRSAAYSWTGFYAGAAIGYGVTRDACGGFAGGAGCFGGTLTVPDFPSGEPTPVPTGAGASLPGTYDNRRTRDGGLAGGQAGANYQLTPGSGWVLGVEADLQAVDFGNRRAGSGPAIFGSQGLYAAPAVLPAVSVFPGQGYGLSPSTGAAGIGLSNIAVFANGVSQTTRGRTVLSTLRARAGYALDRTLVYGTVGLALTAGPDTGAPIPGYANGASVPASFFIGPASQANGSLVVPTGTLFPRRATVGYAFGVGVEHGLTEALSAKIEGLCVSFGRDAGISGARIIGVSNSGAPVTALGGVRGGDRIGLLRGGLNYRFQTL